MLLAFVVAAALVVRVDDGSDGFDGVLGGYVELLVAVALYVNAAGVQEV